MTEFTFSDTDVEVRVSENNAVIHHRETGRYHHAPKSSLPGHYLDNLVPYESKVGARVAYILLSIGLVLLVANLIAITRLSVSGAGKLAPVILAGYTVVNIVMHEGAHILALRFVGRKIDKVGFKMHYVILPAFYVRMNQSHLLDRYERIVVHGAGAFVNLLVNLMFILSISGHTPDLNVALKFVGWAIAVNTLPVLNSDGYRVLLALADHAERRSIGKNPRWIISIKYIMNL